jgi:hypothetical protein
MIDSTGLPAKIKHFENNIAAARPPFWPSNIAWASNARGDRRDALGGAAGGPHCNAGLGDSKLKARLAELGGVPMQMTPAEFGRHIADETEKWGKVIRAANIKAE